MNYKPNNLSNKPIFKVSQLIKQIQQILEASYREVWVEAELSNLSKPASGHWYFSLKDENSQIRCAMFRNRAGISRYQPNEGELVRIRGKVTIYPARGDMQLIVDHIEPAGEGELQRQFERLKLKLQQEGLFSQDKKLTIPTLPKCIGIITSPSGAAIQDVLATLKRRFPSIDVLIYPAVVQGADAATSIISALELASSDNRCDIVLLTRGGGSIEDLWCFNDELLIRKIHDFHIPIISAVGHEVDITLADFVADMRAPTPTAAAELVTPDKNDIFDLLSTSKTRIMRSHQQKINLLTQNVDWITKRLKHPSSIIMGHKTRIIELKQRVENAALRKNNMMKTQLNHIHLRINQLSPQRLIKQYEVKLAELNDRTSKSIYRIVNNKSQQLKYMHTQLETVSHHRTLERGYAMLVDSKENVISSVKNLENNININIILSDGTAKASINSIDKNSSNKSK